MLLETHRNEDKRYSYLNKIYFKSSNLIVLIDTCY